MSFSTRKEDGYSIHHEYSKAITEADISCVSAIMNYILEDGNPFEYEKKSCQTLKLIFLPVCQDVLCDVNLIGQMFTTKCLKWTMRTQNHFFRKIICLTN